MALPNNYEVITYNEIGLCKTCNQMRGTTHLDSCPGAAGLHKEPKPDQEEHIFSGLRFMETIVVEESIADRLRLLQHAAGTESISATIAFLLDNNSNQES